ncbi:hypothetical protein GGS23DRAFT_416115 [Durotheca rogersii]|uniref:uncharacterized protein n=1 Tax=Durotheca rogersii TaxID=419775 RepID=UPI0022204011|nr:uncharacterized protein GGS23DRAFT_416115 [Durotheca rogersii]KAI5865228.1 hypothetical protein GGS23DRAFT_416115 [Durotheca rogersii]
MIFPLLPSQSNLTSQRWIHAAASSTSFRRFATTIKEPVNATILALFMVAPVSEIRNFLQSVRDVDMPTFMPLMLAGVITRAPDGIRAFAECRRLRLTQLLPEVRSPESLLMAVPTAILNEPG